MTPLSGKHLMTKEKESQNVTPVSSSTYLVSRLVKLLGKRDNGPSEKLTEIFNSCLSNENKNPATEIENRIKEMGDVFNTKYTTPNLDHPGSHETIANMRLKCGQILYYKILEAILTKEKAKNKPLAILLDKDMFHRVSTKTFF